MIGVVRVMCSRRGEQWRATSPAWPGFTTRGATKAEAVEALRIALVAKAEQEGVDEADDVLVELHAPYRARAS